MEKTELQVLKTELLKTATADAVVLAAILDKENGNERVLVGTDLGLRLYLEGKEDGSVLFDQQRPLGSLILDHDDQDRGWWCAEIFSLLRDALAFKKDRPTLECAVLGKLQNKLTSDNAISVFVAGRALAYYYPEKNDMRNKHRTELFEQQMLILTRSFREVLLSKENLDWEIIMERLGELFHYTMLRSETDLRIWYPWNKCNEECVVAEESLLPLLLYYLRRLQEWGMCFRICEVCGKIFVAESGHYCLCSAECEKVQNRLNKRAFDQRNRNNRPERLYQQTRDRIRRLLNSFEKLEDMSMEQTDRVEQEYKLFRDEAKYKKANVRTDEDSCAFISWLYEQESFFEMKYGGKE